MNSKLPLSKHTRKQRDTSWGHEALFRSFTEYYLLFSTEQPVPAHMYVCTCMYVCVICITCIIAIASGINQSSLLDICQLHFQACSNAKLLCKLLWEINTINTARFNCPKAHNIFKYCSSEFLLSSSISLLSFFFSLLLTELLPFSFQMRHYPSLWFFSLHQASFCLSFFFVLLFPWAPDKYFPHQSSGGRTK